MLWSIIMEGYRECVPGKWLWSEKKTERTVVLMMRDGGVKVALAGSLNKAAMANTHGYAVAPLIALPGPDL